MCSSTYVRQIGLAFLLTFVQSALVSAGVTTCCNDVAMIDHDASYYTMHGRDLLDGQEICPEASAAGAPLLAGMSQGADCSGDWPCTEAGGCSVSTVTALDATQPFGSTVGRTLRVPALCSDQPVRFGTLLYRPPIAS